MKGFHPLVQDAKVSPCLPTMSTSAPPNARSKSRIVSFENKFGWLARAPRPLKSPMMSLELQPSPHADHEVAVAFSTKLATRAPIHFFELLEEQTDGALGSLPLFRVPELAPAWAPSTWKAVQSRTALLAVE